MARPVSLAQLRADVQLYANQRSTALITPTELDRLINLAITEFYDLLIAARGHEYFEQTATLSTTAGNAIVALPQNFYELLTVLANWGSQQLEELESLDHLGDQVSYRNWNSWAQFSPKAWRLRGQLLEFFPTPTSATVLEIRYIPACPTLTDPLQTMDGIGGWEKLIAARAAMELLGLQAMPMDFPREVYEREKDRIEGLAADRAAANGPSIRDVYGDSRNGSWWRRLPRATV